MKPNCTANPLSGSAQQAHPTSSHRGKEDDALAELLARLDARGYQFVTPNNRTYKILRRRDGPRVAANLRDVLGWSLPYVAGTIDPPVEALLDRAGQVVRQDGHERARLRASTVGGQLFLHSAYGAGTDAVFLGPDTYRFASYLTAELTAGPSIGSILDIGAGAGAGGVTAARCTGANHVVLADINPQALRWAAISARHAGIRARTVLGAGLDGTTRYDLIVANPPFIAGGGKTATAGGKTGTEVSLDWARRAMSHLRPGGRLLLYTGAPMVGGRDVMADGLRAAAHDGGCRLDYRELDPDIFSETLRQPAYAGVERIAAVGAAFLRLT
jgi:methylase of polypeptide subunit release factors